MSASKTPLNLVFKDHYKQYGSYDGLAFISDGKYYKVSDNKRMLVVTDRAGKNIFKARIPYINLFKKLSDSLTPGSEVYKNFQKKVIETGKGNLKIASLSFSLYKEKDSIIVDEGDVEVAFTGIPEALCHVRKVLNDKLNIIVDAVYEEGDKVILGKDENGEEKVGIVTEVTGDQIKISIDGAEIETTQEDLDESANDVAEEVTDSIRKTKYAERIFALPKNYLKKVVWDGTEKDLQLYKSLIRDYSILGSRDKWYYKIKDEYKPLSQEEIQPFKDAAEALNKKYGKGYHDYKFIPELKEDGYMTIQLVTQEKNSNGVATGQKPFTSFRWVDADIRKDPKTAEEIVAAVEEKGNANGWFTEGDENKTKK
jgi:hypothetical protein